MPTPKLSRDHTEQIERHVIRFIGLSRLNEEDKKHYDRLNGAFVGHHTWTISERYESSLLDKKISSVSRLREGNLWRKTKGDFDAVVKWVEKYGDEKALKVLRQIAVNGIESAIGETK